jgi:ribosomal subunit interface protein
MQIQINSDNHIAIHAKLSNFIETELHRVLHRFDRQLTRVEVHLSDENASKAGPNDKRCKLEVRPRGLHPLIVTGAASNTEQCICGAAEKMKRQLDATFGRLAARRFNIAQPNYDF